MFSPLERSFVGSFAVILKLNPLALFSKSEKTIHSCGHTSPPYAPSFCLFLRRFGLPHGHIAALSFSLSPVQFLVRVLQEVLRCPSAPGIHRHADTHANG